MMGPAVPDAGGLIHAVNVRFVPVTSSAAVFAMRTKLLPLNCSAPPKRPATRVGPLSVPVVTPARSVTVLPDVSLNVQPPASPGRAFVLVFASESCWLGFGTVGQLSVASGTPSQSWSPAQGPGAVECPSIISMRLPTASYWYCTSRPSGYAALIRRDSLS